MFDNSVADKSLKMTAVLAMLIASPIASATPTTCVQPISTDIITSCDATYQDPYDTPITAMERIDNCGAKLSRAACYVFQSDSQWAIYESCSCQTQFDIDSDQAFTDCWDNNIDNCVPETHIDGTSCRSDCYERELQTCTDDYNTCRDSILGWAFGASVVINYTSEFLAYQACLASEGVFGLVPDIVGGVEGMADTSDDGADMFASMDTDTEFSDTDDRSCDDTDSEYTDTEYSDTDASEYYDETMMVYAP
ncbi:MAG: hypothetical protein ACI9OJ_001116 [Myxococcota bacterium]|jgi:hypothetical protein